MAYNTKEIITDVDGQPIAQYYNKASDKYEPVEGSKGGNKVLIQNNDLSLIPILKKLSQLTGTILAEETRESNELQRIAFFEMLQKMLADGELKGEQGIQGLTGKGLEFTWRGTELGVRIEGQTNYIYVNLKGEKGSTGSIDNLEYYHIISALEYTPLGESNIVNNLTTTVVGKVLDGRQGKVLSDKIGNLTTLKTNQKGNIVGSINELFQNVSDGKEVVATAITGKGIPTSSSDTFQKMATNISNIQTKSILTGNAVASNVLQGKTFYNNSETKLTGSMVNRGSVLETITTQGGQFNIQEGYYTGGSIKAQFDNLLEDILEGISAKDVVHKPYVEGKHIITLSSNTKVFIQNLTLTSKVPVSEKGHLIWIKVGNVWNRYGKPSTINEMTNISGNKFELEIVGSLGTSLIVFGTVL